MYIIIASRKCIHWFELVSQVSDVTHGPLVSIWTTFSYTCIIKNNKQQVLIRAFHKQLRKDISSEETGSVQFPCSHVTTGATRWRGPFAAQRSSAPKMPWPPRVTSPCERYILECDVTQQIYVLRSPWLKASLSGSFR